MPMRIGKSLLKKKLGAVANGSVYLALDEFSGREVALKFYEAGKAADISNFARSQFLTEAALAGRLWHPHIALQVFRRARYAFRNNVIHRDIKPGNILRTADTQVKISDFGVAFIRNAQHTQIRDAGSPYYASRAG